MSERRRPQQRRVIVGAAVLAAALAPILIGSATAAPVCNTTPIVFTPPPQPTQAILPLAPYPSTIEVSGATGTITDVNVTLNDITYPFPEDLDVLLVAPDGTTRLVVMSDIGGTNGGAANSITDVDLTFDDEAAGPAPFDDQLVSGTFRPSDDDVDIVDFNPTDTFPAPAPDAGSATALSVFDGLNPNGTWRLYVVDDEPGPNTPGDIGGGWCIDITTSGVSPTSAPTSSTTTSTSTTSTTLQPTTTSTSTTSTTLQPTTTSTTSTTLAPTTTSTSTSTSTTSVTIQPTTTSTSTSTTVLPPTTTSTSTTSTTLLPPTTTTSTSTTSTTVPPVPLPPDIRSILCPLLQQLAANEFFRPFITPLLVAFGCTTTTTG